MAKSLIEELPRIVSEGRREAAQILERLSSGTQIGLQTNEFDHGDGSYDHYWNLMIWESVSHVS